MALLGSLMGGMALIQRRMSPHPELVRKGMHVGMGLVTLTFPWVFQESWPVTLLAVLAVVALLAVRLLSPIKAQLGNVLGGVKRFSLGELYFPIAVAIVFWLARGDKLLFCIPILILSLADAVCALIGLRYGLSKYRTNEGEKSVEGSLAFFLIAFFSTHIPLLLFTTIGRAEILLISIALGFLVMLMEAIAWGGLDNLFIPLTSYLLLRIYVTLSVTELAVRLVVMVLLTAFLIPLRRRSTLNGSAALCAGMLCYVAWALGGLPWLLAPLIGLAAFPSLSPLHPEIKRESNVHTVIRVMAGPLFWLGISLEFKRPELIYLFYLTLGAQLAGICITRRALATNSSLQRRPLLECVIGGWLILFIPYLLIDTITARTVIEALAAPIIILVAGLAHNASLPCTTDTSPGLAQWLRENLCIPVVSTLGLIPHFLL
ncbi:MAG: phosphatidate cytidylyltransferase [Chthoniobacteraceae bacterium]|nr:phosphatidate cytidylyltransferase [Chthoniobacteraceae bacterium]